MVCLVLEDLREQSRSAALDLLAFLAEGFQGHARRAGDFAVEPAHRQAALFDLFLLARALDDLRIDEDEVGIVAFVGLVGLLQERAVDREDLERFSDLRRGDGDAVLLAPHGRLHESDDSIQARRTDVFRLHRLGFLAQYGRVSLDDIGHVVWRMF